MSRFELVAASLLGFALSACSNPSHRIEEASSVPEKDITVARKTGATGITEFRFTKGSATLTQRARRDLDQLVESARKTGQVAEIKVAAWADEEYPAKGVEPSKAQRDLAEKRADVVKNYLKKQLEVSKVETLNMAERPSSIEDFFKTNDAQIKHLMEKSGTTTSKAKASQALVMIYHKH